MSSYAEGGEIVPPERFHHRVSTWDRSGEPCTVVFTGSAPTRVEWYADGRVFINGAEHQHSRRRRIGNWITRAMDDIFHGIEAMFR